MYIQGFISKCFTYTLFSLPIFAILKLLAKVWLGTYAFSINNVKKSNLQKLVDVASKKFIFVNKNWYNIIQLLDNSFLLGNCKHSRLFRTLSNISDGAFCENCQRLKSVNYFRKTLHLKYSTGF